MIRRTQSRRGVVILIVLSLLVLFVLLVVTFAIVAGQYRRAAEAVGRREWLGEDPQKTADRVMYTLVREADLNQTGSPFRGHSLLTDVYGVSYRGKVFGGSAPLAGGVQSGDQRPQIWQFNFTPQPPWTPSTLNGFYNGSVLTLIDRLTPPRWKLSTPYLLYATVEPTVSNGFWYLAVGAGTSAAMEPTWPTTLGVTVNDGGVTWRCIKPASGPLNIVSTRVVGYSYTPPNIYTLQIINPQYDSDSIVGPQHDATFVLNGKPFVGTGFGLGLASRWTSSTTYALGSRCEPTTHSPRPYRWRASTPYSLGTNCEPRVSNGFWYRAVQAGTSGATEPTNPTPWPTVLGQTVDDGTVKWLCTYPFCYIATAPGTSGATEPTWPTVLGQPVVDGSVTWRCQLLPRLTDNALKPNRTGDNLATLLDWAYGGANESYDAADYQNMILSAVAYDPNRNSMRVLPSFHREEMIAHWMARDASTTDPNGWNMLGGLTDTRYTNYPAISLTASPNNIYSNLTAANFDLRRKLVFRPMPWDHPNFTGSNVAFDGWSRSAKQIDEALAQGWVDLNGNGVFDNNEVAWDVDNDGDGIKDSIWIDPDLPIQTTEDGRVFRPLVAIHCVDLDGRLNVNAHGNLAHITDTTLNASDATLKLVPNPPNTVATLAGNVSANVLPKGQGYGPPEINLLPLILPPLWTQTTGYALEARCRPTTPNGFAYRAIAAGVSGLSEPLWPTSLGATVLDGSVTWQCISLRAQVEYLALLHNRYGTDIDTTTTTYYHLPGALGFDTLAEFKFFEYPANYATAADLTSFFSNMDLRGQFAFGVDYFGQPLYEYMNASVALLANNPYEFSPGRPSGSDTPFTPAELERVLRYGDYDAGTLDARLQNLLTVLSTDPSARRCITTDSYDFPVPAVVGTEDYLNTTYGSSVPIPQTILDLLAARLLKENVPPANVNGEIQKLLYSNCDLTMGLKLDLNRPFGNGRDGNNNGVVDEPGETAAAEYTVPRATATALMPIDPGNDGVLGNNDGYLARQSLARHLYVLAMLLKDEGYYFDFDGDDKNPAEETAAVLAQWAINVVDFRDADSIMTPFEYQTDPFSGWFVDGNISTDEASDGVDNNGDGLIDAADPKEKGRAVVWGCERPELLITEALAFHDRRTEDLVPLQDDEDDGTQDFDQRLRPRGALFVELYNPWTGNDRHPGEFYYTTAWKDGVLLNKRHLGASGSPVWRLVITKDEKSEQPSNIERTVYFTDPVALGDGDLGDSTHYSTESDLAPLVPGRYAVIGPARYKDNGTKDYATTIGRRTDATEGGSLNLDKTRQIVLTPSTDYNTNQVRLINNSNPPDTGDPADFDSPWNQFSAPTPGPSTLATPKDIQPAIAVPVDSVRQNTTTTLKIPLSISEKIGGYPDPNDDAGDWDPSLADGEGAYTIPADAPMDDDDDLVPPGNKTTKNHRRIHLQRLANPTEPYNSATNPYMTIDVIPVGLTVFNGVTAATDNDNKSETKMLKAVQRGHSDSSTAAPYERKLWPQEENSDDVEEGDLDDKHIYGCILDNTLGYLNAKYQSRYSQLTAPTASYVGAPIAITPSADGYPFPWLPWNNRPFVSPTELLLVPRSSPAALLADFEIANGTGGEYDDQTGRFAHLLSLFHTGHYSLTATKFRVAAANLYRLLDYVTVPSRFLGTETRLNPSIFVRHHTAEPGTELRHPPFNVISDYREPGRINLNTVYDPRVWNAIWGPHDGINPDHQQISFTDFIDNRRGYTAATAGALFANDLSRPTFFSNPYRVSGSPFLCPADVSGGIGLARLEIEGTMLRTDRVLSSLTSAPPPSYKPGYLNIFDYDTSSDAKDVPRDSDRNEYFGYQALQRLSNLVTCRSNVYALWLTIGYFEVEGVNAAGQPILGQEVGLDTGTVKRHRAFYIIDRTIPVAFEPGQNHNVDKCVLLRRFIE